MSIATKIVGVLKGVFGIGLSGGNLVVTAPNAGNAVIEGVLTVQPSMSGSSQTSNFLNVTGTLPAVLAATTFGANIVVTPAGSSDQQLAAIGVSLGAGYTGSNLTYAALFQNTCAGTGTGVTTGNRNIGFFSSATATTAGTNCGIVTRGSGGNINTGGVLRAINAKNGATNIGCIGMGLNTGTTPIQIGGYFGLSANDPTTFASAALICDNEATTSDIFVARDNEVACFTIADGGGITGTATWTTTTLNATTAVQSNGAKINYTLSVYAAGTAYQLTNTSAALDFGTTDPSLVLDTAGTYRLSARVDLLYNAATFAANRVVTLKLRRTNNTAADVTNSTCTVTTGIVTTFTSTFVVVQLPEVIYTTALTNDAIAIFGDVATAPSAGSLDAVEASIVATRIY